MSRRVFISFEYVMIYLFGAAGYVAIELLWRGYSHWTMGVTGGACFFVIYLCECVYEDEKLWKKCLIGSLTITIAELVVGACVNIILEWGIWDYSNLHFNVCGQISLLYFALWFVLCVPLSYLCRGIKRVTRQCEEKLMPKNI